MESKSYDGMERSKLALGDVDIGTDRHDNDNQRQTKNAAHPAQIALYLWPNARSSRSE